MSVDNAILVTFITTILAINVADSFAECVSQTPCSCVMSNGQGYDLSKIGGTKDDFIESTTVYNRTFYLHPCGKKDLPPGKIKPSCIDASLCMYNETLSTVIRFEETKITLSSTDQPHLIYETSIGKSRVTVNVTLVCDPFLNVPPILVEFNNTASASNHSLILVSPHACRKLMHSSGLSTGSVLVIMLLVFSGVYFLGGAVALKLVRGATGWEMLPNHKFWFDLPALVRDGIAFTFNGCRTVSYNQI
ncbi:uncharacterized protein LOC105689036 [Athalia rosae]|uniref:uncharacterized protein LOC105689036 n=1 Tax=Athalia rosae TaxID=37344 RepID=UPI0020343A73|nr:uncharacterized protein LOC105689036 [Athalia rosae]